VICVGDCAGGHGYNAFDGTNDPSDDSTSHGTMVAGVLGAVGNNGKGVTGVAWQVQMMACKCLNNSSGSDSTVIACIDYALTNGARIINASFDSPTPSLALSNAIVAAQVAGVIWVASAGNNSYNVEVNPSYVVCTSDSPPGNLVMWRGLTRLHDIQLGFTLANKHMGN
jgi:subtilisin family serine protease